MVCSTALSRCQADSAENSDDHLRQIVICPRSKGIKRIEEHITPALKQAHKGIFVQIFNKAA
jgi:hypothetical protein